MAYLLTYDDEQIPIDDAWLKRIDEIAVATITVVTGDEMLEVLYKDGHRDGSSAFSAYIPYYDGAYDIIVNGEWVVDKEAWLNRKESGDFLYRF